MAVKYTVNGTSALKVNRAGQAQLRLVTSNSSSLRTAGAHVLDVLGCCGHERTDVDVVLDDFSGTSFVRTRSDKLFCACALGIGMALLVALTLVSAL